MSKKNKRITTDDIQLSEADVQRLVGEVAEAEAAHTAELAKLNRKLDEIRAAYEPRLTALATEVETKSRQIEAWVLKNRPQFESRRSREFPRGEIGLRWGQWAVKTLKGVKQADVVARLKQFRWGKAFLKQAEPTLDKEALLKARESLTTERQLAAGIEFVREERFYIEPKADGATAAPALA